jgi:hypothetical protein
MADNTTKKQESTSPFLHCATILPIEGLPKLEGEPLISPEARREILQKLDELSNQPCDFRSIMEELDNIAKR